MADAAFCIGVEVVCEWGAYRLGRRTMRRQRRRGETDRGDWPEYLVRKVGFGAYARVSDEAAWRIKSGDEEARFEVERRFGADAAAARDGEEGS